MSLEWTTGLQVMRGKGSIGTSKIYWSRTGDPKEDNFGNVGCTLGVVQLPKHALESCPTPLIVTICAAVMSRFRQILHLTRVKMPIIRDSYESNS